MQRLFDRGLPPGPVDPETVYARLDLPAGDARPYTVVTMISTLDGKAVVGPPGSTWSLGSEGDHLLFKQIQRNCDAILAGAGVMRADDIPYPRLSPEEAERRQSLGLRPQPLWVIVSGRGYLPPDLRIFRADPSHLLVVTPEEVPDLGPLEGRAQHRAYGKGRVDLGAMMRALRQEFGIGRVDSLGGPILNGAMLEAGLLDELFLTLAPKIQNGAKGVTSFEGHAFPPERLASATLISLYRSGDELYLRYRL